MAALPMYQGTGASGTVEVEATYMGRATKHSSTNERQAIVTRERANERQAIVTREGANERQAWKEAPQYTQAWKEPRSP